MQINSKISDFVSGSGLRILKNLLFAGVLYSVYVLLEQKGERITEVVEHFRQTPFNLTLIAVLLLIPVNWAFEAWKWQRLAAKVEKISFAEAYRAVLAGLALANIMPLMIGDYAGKIGMLKSAKRTDSIGAVLLGNSIQLYVSLLFGWLGYLYFVRVANPAPFLLHIYIVTILGVLLLIGLGLAFLLPSFRFVESPKRTLNYILRYLNIIKEYSRPEIWDIFLIATGRYIIFTVQFLMVLRLFKIDLPVVVLLAGIGIVFLTKTLGSALSFLGDLSMRAITSVYYFGYFGVSISLITTATLAIWLVNVLVPLIVGSVFVLSLRLPNRNAPVTTM